MRNLLLIMIAAILLIACDKKEVPPIDKGKPDPTALITIKPGKNTKAMEVGLSNRQIVEDALYITYTSNYSNNQYEKDAKSINRGFNEDMKDLDKLELKMLGIDVVTAEGEYYRDLTYAYDVYVVSENRDTIAYVPDKVIEDARVAIEAAFKDNDYNTIYDLFNTAFIFLPIDK